VHAILGLTPELDSFGHDPERSPIRGTLGRRLEDVHKMRMAFAQWLDVLDRLALS
jgi:hypothetical protein